MAFSAGGEADGGVTAGAAAGGGGIVAAWSGVAPVSGVAAVPVSGVAGIVVLSAGVAVLGAACATCIGAAGLGESLTGAEAGQEDDGSCDRQTFRNHVFATPCE